MSQNLFAGTTPPSNNLLSLLDANFTELYAGITVADGAAVQRWKGATGMLRLRPYVDATYGATLEAQNAAESANVPFTLTGSPLRFITNFGLAATVDASGNLLVLGIGLGYGTGSGGAVTQITSKATGVTLNKPCGQITTNNAALAANTTVLFTVTNSLVAATDVVDCVRQSGGTAGAYNVVVDSVAAGSFVVAIRNTTGGSLSEALVLNFAVTKSVAA